MLQIDVLHFINLPQTNFDKIIHFFPHFFFFFVNCFVHDYFGRIFIVKKIELYWNENETKMIIRGEGGGGMEYPLGSFPNIKKVLQCSLRLFES